MENNKFENIVKKIKENLKLNKKVINDAIDIEKINGHILDFNEIIEYIDFISQYLIQAEKKVNVENTVVAIMNNGNYQVILNFILDAILRNYNVCLYIDAIKELNITITTIIEKTLEELNIKNKFKLITDNSEQELIYNQNKFDRIIYVGDFFEFDNLQYYINKKIEYDSFGFIKVYIDTDKYMEEYKEFAKYTYKNNIAVEYYHDKEEFFDNIDKQDTVVICEKAEEVEVIKSKLKVKNFFDLELFYNKYKFAYIYK